MEKKYVPKVLLAQWLYLKNVFILCELSRPPSGDQLVANVIPNTVRPLVSLTCFGMLRYWSRDWAELKLFVPNWHKWWHAYQIFFFFVQHDRQSRHVWPLWRIMCASVFERRITGCRSKFKHIACSLCCRSCSPVQCFNTKIIVRCTVFSFRLLLRHKWRCVYSGVDESYDATNANVFQANVLAFWARTCMRCFCFSKHSIWAVSQ